MLKAESPACTINSTSDNDRILLKEKPKSLARKYVAPLTLRRGQHHKAKFVVSGKTEDCFCLAKICEVSLEHSHLIDYEGNSALLCLGTANL